MRRALKILLISGAFMVLVAGLGIYALVSKFNRDVVGIEQMQAERYNEVERIKALPELQAIVVSAGTVRAPFSHADVAAYALTQALLMQMSGPTGGRSSGPSSGPRYDHDDDVIFMGAPDLELSIGGLPLHFPARFHHAHVDAGRSQRQAGREVPQQPRLHALRSGICGRHPRGESVGRPIRGGEQLCRWQGA
ncbi:MAG: hypothetical protein IPO05_13925 [Flavobacteriales bacterium]|nr:hypothetical protein [Flavobacteriales bacterium]